VKDDTVFGERQDKLLRQDLFEEFCDEFTREMNRLRMKQRASLSAAEREVARIEVRRKKLVESIMEGVPVSEVRDELNANAARREELKAKLASADEPPPLLHPGMADLYRQKVTALAQALERPETRTEASEALRGLIRRHRPDAEAGRTANRAERASSGDAGCCSKCEEVARNRRPLAASCDGCGGPQPSEFGVRLGRCVTQRPVHSSPNRLLRLDSNQQPSG
jgi:hypothetical protein